MPPWSVIISRLRACSYALPQHCRVPRTRWRPAHLTGAALLVLGLGIAGTLMPWRAEPSTAVQHLSDPGLGSLDAPRGGLASWTATGHELTSSGLRRGYLLLTPRRPAPGPMPLLIALHGRNMTPSGLVRRAGLLGMRDVVIAAPAGYGRSWNAGRCCAAAHAAGVDDVRFVSDVVAQVLRQERQVDPHQVYLLGYSNGGRMAYRVACRRPDLFAGVAAVEAVPMADCPRIARPVPMIVVASSGDPLLRLRSDAPQRPVEGQPQPSVEDAVRVWRTLDGCAGAPRTEAVGTLTGQAWTSCRDGSRVGYDLYAGGSHAWPVGNTRTPGALVEIWGFFRADL